MFITILDEHNVTHDQFKIFESGVNVLIDTYEQCKSLVGFNQHFINPEDLLSLKIEDTFSP